MAKSVNLLQHTGEEVFRLVEVGEDEQEHYPTYGNMCQVVENAASRGKDLKSVGLG